MLTCCLHQGEIKHPKHENPYKELEHQVETGKIEVRRGDGVGMGGRSTRPGSTSSDADAHTVDTTLGWLLYLHPC